MRWVLELDKFGYNIIIDELVWHIENKRIPHSIQNVKEPESGLIFRFKCDDSSFLKASEESIEMNWEETKTITSNFKEIENVIFKNS